MGNAPSLANAILAFRGVDPGQWPSEGEFRTSVERLGIGGKPTTDPERSLAVLIEVIQDLRDEIVEDSANDAIKYAVAATQVSNAVAAENAMRAVLDGAVPGASFVPNAAPSAASSATFVPNAAPSTNDPAAARWVPPSGTGLKFDSLFA